MLFHQLREAKKLNLTSPPEKQEQIRNETTDDSLTLAGRTSDEPVFGFLTMDVGHLDGCLIS